MSLCMKGCWLHTICILKVGLKLKLKFMKSRIIQQLEDLTPELYQFFDVNEITTPEEVETCVLSLSDENRRERFRSILGNFLRIYGRVAYSQVQEYTNTMRIVFHLFSEKCDKSICRTVRSSY